MTAVDPLVRATVYGRDGHRCIVCGTTRDLTFQHRAATGMGGGRRPVDASGGLTACLAHNEGFEASGQAQALVWGWKVPRWLREEAASVPVFYPIPGRWFLLDAAGQRFEVSAMTAEATMRDLYGEDEWEAMKGRAA